MRKPRRFEIFNKIPLIKPKRSLFNLSFENKLTTDLFRLTPIAAFEGLPDDVVRISPEVFVRTAPFSTPVMHRFDVRTYWFFVPNRLIWDDWEKFINPKSGESDIVHPRIKADHYKMQAMIAPKTLGDYLGVNAGLSIEDYAKLANGVEPAQIFPIRDSEVTETFKYPQISALPFRAYQKIYQDWFIDLNNIEAEPELDTSSGVFDLHNEDAPAVWTDENVALYNSLLKMRYRCWQHDYFTSAMPEPQRGPDVMAFEGADAVSITGNENVLEVGAEEIAASGLFDPTGDISGEISTQDFASYVIDNWQSFDFADQNAAINYVTQYMPHGLPEVEYMEKGLILDEPDLEGYGFNVNGKWLLSNFKAESKKISGAQVANLLTVDGGAVPGVTVEELRIRMQMQSFLERNEIAGSRYTELLYAHWGVKSPDGRLQRSEFIGGSKQPIMINEVTQFSQTTDEDPLGSYAGQGSSAKKNRTFKYRVPEHGFIIGLMCIVPKTGYFQGIHPMWSRFDKLDYYWPEFAHLGEQEVKNKEIMYTGFDPDGTFGYQQRYAEYKCQNDSIHGDLKGDLAFWHAARAFNTPTDVEDLPKLSEKFTTPESSAEDDVDRIFPVRAWSGGEWLNADHFICDIYNHITGVRRMPKFVIPRNGS